MGTFPLIVGIVGTAIIGAIALIVVIYMAIGKIDLSGIISDSADASLSRFQFLVFTFIIGLSYLLVTLVVASSGQAAGLPEIPANVVVLLGVSGGSYVLSKGIQRAAETSQANAAQPSPPASPITSVAENTTIVGGSGS